MSVANFIIYTDGASRGNPGPAAAAFIFLQNEEVILEKNFHLGVQTNNQAEYHAIIKALEYAKEFTQGKITIFSDSELVVKQLNNEYRVNKPHLKELFDKVEGLMKQVIGVEFKHVPRSNKWIKLADQLCNQILNQQTT